MKLRTIPFLVLFLLVPWWSAGQPVSGANSRTIRLSEDLAQPAISEISLEIPVGAILTEINGHVFFEHPAPFEVRMFLVHPLAAVNQPPQPDLPWDLQLMLDFVDVGLAVELLNPFRTYVIRLENPFQDHQEYDGAWSLVLFDIVPNNVFGNLVQWDLDVSYRHDSPPEIIEWAPENGTIISEAGVDLSFESFDPDGDEIEHFINIYRDNRLVANRSSESVQWNPVRDRLQDGIYEIEFLALSGPGDRPRFTVRRIVVEVDGDGPTWRSISPLQGKVLSGIERIEFDATDGGSFLLYTYRFGVGSGLEGSIQQVPGVKAAIMVDTRQLRDGYHWLLSNVYDWVGNAADSQPMARSYLIDNSAPVVFFETVLVNNINLNSNMITVSAADDYSDIRRVKIYLNDALMIDQTLTGAGRTKKLVFILPEDLRADHYTLTVDAEDAAHNIGRGVLAFLYTYQPLESEAPSKRDSSDR